MTDMKFSVHIQNDHEFDNIPDRFSLQRWVSETLEDHRHAAELCVRFVSEIESAELNFHYRQHNKPTNVLSFPVELPAGVDIDNHYIGDIALCPMLINQQAKDYGIDSEEHWAHLIVHGVLHLLGYDHIDEQQAREMESLEINILQRLGFSNPYEETDEH